MTIIKQAIKQIPGSLSLYNAMRRRADRPEWYFGYRRWMSAARMRQFYNKHAGKRCFIIGSGPSLNRMDLSPLQHEFTFGMNRIYLLFPRVGFETTYFVSVNPLVVEQFGSDIAQLTMPKFIGWHGRDLIPFTPSTILLASPTVTPLFSEQPAHLIYEGATVTYAAMQIAYYMGFSEVILIGVDHNFTDQGRPHQLVVTETHDANHFDPNYFGKGCRWNLPDLNTSEMAYRLARHHYEANGRRIRDATVGGNLTVFEKVEFKDLFD